MSKEVEIGAIYPWGVKFSKTGKAEITKFLNGTEVILFEDGGTEIIDPQAPKAVFGRISQEEKKAA